MFTHPSSQKLTLVISARLGHTGLSDNILKLINQLREAGGSAFAVGKEIDYLLNICYFTISLSIHIHSIFLFEPPFLCYPFLALLAMKIQSVSERVGATYFRLLSPPLKMFYAPQNLSETISRPTHSRSD